MYDCITILKLLYPYLDGELDIKESLRVQCHLEECHYCREIFRQEKEFLQAFKASVSTPPAPYALRERIRASMVKTQGGTQPARSVPAGRHAYSFSWSFVAAASAVLIMIVSGFFLYTLPDQISENRNELVKAAVNSHIAITTGEDPCDIRSTDPSDILRWLESKLEFPVVVPQGEFSAMRLVCGKLVHLPKKEKGALLRFASASGPVTLVEAAPHFSPSHSPSIPIKKLLSPKGREIYFRNILFYFDQYDGYYTLFWADPKLNYALVSDRKASIAEACRICHMGGDQRKIKGFEKTL